MSPNNNTKSEVVRTNELASHKLEEEEDLAFPFFVSSLD